MLEELQISDEMLALKHSQAKLAAFFPEPRGIVRPFQRHTACTVDSAGTDPAKRAEEQGWRDLLMNGAGSAARGSRVPKNLPQPVPRKSRIPCPEDWGSCKVHAGNRLPFARVNPDGCPRW